MNIETLGTWREEIASGARLGPRLWLAGPVAKGSSGEGKLTASSPAAARHAISEIERRGGDFVKVYEHIPLPAYRALMEEASRRGLSVAGHVSEETLTIMDALRLGQASIEHVRSHLLVCFAADDKELAAFFEADGWTAYDREWGTGHRSLCPAVWESLRRGGTWLTPTLAVARTHQVGGSRGFDEDLRRRSLPEPITRSVQEFSSVLRARSDEERDRALAWWQAQLAFVDRARSEGVHMLAGSDAACEGVIPGYGLHDQLRLFVEAGLTPLEALRTATVEPAAFLGRTSDRGRLLPGAEADLLLLRSDPVSDVSALTQIEALVLRGRLFHSCATRLAAYGARDGWPGLVNADQLCGASVVRGGPRLVDEISDHA